MTADEDEAPDWVPATGFAGTIGCMVPNYDKPGVRDRVDRDCLAAEFAARPATDHLGLSLQMLRAVRLEEEIERRNKEGKL